MSKLFIIQESLEEKNNQSIVIIGMKASDIIFWLVLILMTGFLLACGFLITITGLMSKSIEPLLVGTMFLLIAFVMSWSVDKFVKEKVRIIRS